MKDDYKDIINFNFEPKHPRMDKEARASQFAPFAALTGHSDAVKEVARITEERIELDEEVKIMLNEKLRLIQNNINNKPEVELTYFIPDKLKNGGSYTSKKGIVKKIDVIEGYIILTDKTKIPINEIISIVIK